MNNYDDHSFKTKSVHLSTPDSSARDLFYLPLNGDQNLVDHKARLYRSNAIKRFHKKVVGVVGSRGPVGQAAQAAGSMILPGNVSPVRSPIRSGLARALTPGGGGGRGGLPNPNERGYRCAEGFQVGGRFTDENYSTCGKQLFDIPSLRETLGQAVYRTRARRKSTAVAGGTTVDAEALRGQAVPEDPQLMIRRALRVSEVGPMNADAREEGIKQAAQAVSNQDADSGVLVRRDGFVMVPVVSSAELREVPDNRNMEEAAFIQSVREASGLGGDELRFLSNTGVTSLVYVTPNGVQIRLDRTRDLSTGERRQLGKDANTAADMPVDKNPTARLDFIVENADGAFKMSKDFGDVEDPEADADGMPKWAKEAFSGDIDERVEEDVDLTEGEGEPEPGEAAPEAAPRNVAPVKPEERIDSIKEAVEHINKGGLLSEIDPAIVLEALEQAELYEPTNLRDDITLYETEDGRRVIVKDNNETFEHLSAHLSSEMLRELGVQAPAVRFAGEGDDRPFYYRSPDNVIEGAGIAETYDPETVPPEQVLGVQVADWLTDTRERTSGSLFTATVGQETELVAGVGPLSALVGLDADELEERRQVGLEDFFNGTTERYGRKFADIDEQGRDVVIRILDQLIARAEEFSWADYLEKLSVDGKLSQAEQQHLEIVRKVFATRLTSLRESREMILQVVGA